MKLRHAAIVAPVFALAALACGSSDQAADPDGSGSAFSEKQSSGRSLPPMTLALTFDDGPGPRTKELSSYLKSQGIASGFFMMGQNAQGKSDVMKQVNDDGHIIGNHTWDHPLLTKLSASAVQTELQRTDDVIGPFLKGNMRMFRAPFGGWSPATADHLNKTPLAKYVGSIFWDIGGDLTATHAADWACWGAAKLTIEQCGDRYIREIHDRGDHGVVLMHDIHSNTIDMVKVIVPKLKALGYKFVRIDQVPDINAQLIANGATPSAESGVTSPPAPPPECAADGMLCGALVGKDPHTLFSCKSHRLDPACVCQGDCNATAHGSECDCAAGEPGALPLNP